MDLTKRHFQEKSSVDTVVRVLCEWVAIKEEPVGCVV